MDCSPPGPSVHGIFQARVLEWGAIAFSEKNCYIYTLFGPYRVKKCINVYTSRKAKKKDPKQNNPGTLTMPISRFWLYGFYFVLFFFAFSTLHTQYVLLLQPEK